MLSNFTFKIHLPSLPAYKAGSSQSIHSGSDLELGARHVNPHDAQVNSVQAPDHLEAPSCYGGSVVGGSNVSRQPSFVSSTASLVKNARRAPTNGRLPQQTTALAGLQSRMFDPAFVVTLATVVAVTFGLTFAIQNQTMVQPLKHQVATQKATIAMLENTTYPIYAKLMPQTPVSLYNQAYDTHYADNSTGQNELFAAHQIPWNASLPINLGYDCVSEMMKTDCSIPGMFYQQLGSTDLRLLADNRNDTGPVGVLMTGKGPNPFNFYVPEPLNVTGVRGPMPVDLSTEASAAGYNNAGYQENANTGVGSFRPSLNGKALDANRGVLLASPLKNGVSTGFLLSVPDDQGAYSLTLQLRTTAPESIFYCDDSAISHFNCQK